MRMSSFLLVCSTAILCDIGQCRNATRAMAIWHWVFVTSIRGTGCDDLEMCFSLSLLTMASSVLKRPAAEQASS